MQDTNA